MTDDGSRLLDLVGVALVLFVLAGLGIAVLAATNAPSGQFAGPPETDWTLERANGTHVRIVHAGGDPVAAENLVVTVEGYERRVTWSGRLTEGDAGVVPASGGQTVRLYWTDGERTRRLLARWRIS